MNDKQKIFVMVGVGSFAIFFITIWGLDQFSIANPFQSWHALGVDAIKSGKRHTNWIGMIAIFNIAVSITGFFLFKDK